MSLLFEHPVWLLLPGGLSALLLAVWLYRSDKTTRHLSGVLRFILGSLRFLALFVLIVLLLKPLIKTLETETETPLIVIAQDNSESLALTADSTFMKESYPDQIRSLSSALEQDYRVQSYRFGEGLNPDLNDINYTQANTNFSVLFDELFNQYSHRNLGAVIIASDGIYNKGQDPSYMFSKLNVPVYTIALGDTLQRKDVLIQDVVHNRLAYLGNFFPLKIQLAAKKCAGDKLKLEVLRKGKVVFSQEETISQNNQEFTIPVQLEAKEVGLQRYSIRLNRLEDEISEVNNRQDIFIDVLDTRQKILILAAAPHPDLAAFRSSIESNQNYEVEVVLADDFKGLINDYSLVVFHQLPSKGALGMEQIEQAKSAKVPMFFIAGAQSNFAKFNELGLGYQLLNHQGNVNDVNPLFAEGFKVFQVSDAEKKLFAQLPPLQVPFGEFVSSPSTQTILYQSIGRIATEIPMLSFQQKQDQKIALLSGEGIWRWRMIDFLNSGNHDTFNSFMKKTVQFMAAKDDKRPFRVEGKTALLENEQVRFTAEVYDANYLPIPGKDVRLNIINSNDESFDFTFTPETETYRLNAGRLPVDQYRWEAEVNIAGKTYKERGEFSVSPVQLEMVNLQADHQMLYRLALKNGGEMVNKEQIGTLAELVRSNGEVVSLSYERKTLSDLIRWDSLLILLTLLLAAEWLLRKINGTY